MTVYSLEDPAIDWDAMVEADEQKRPRETLAKAILSEAMRKPSILRERLKFKAGASPCRFTIGVLPSDAFTRVVEEHSSRIGVFWWCCFLHGLRSLDWPDKPETHTVDGVEYIKPDWLKRTFVRHLRVVAEEIGGYVLAFNKVEEEEVHL